MNWNNRTLAGLAFGVIVAHNIFPPLTHAGAIRLAPARTAPGTTVNGVPALKPQTLNPLSNNPALAGGILFPILPGAVSQQRVDTALPRVTAQSQTQLEAALALHAVAANDTSISYMGMKGRAGKAVVTPVRNDNRKTRGVLKSVRQFAAGIGAVGQKRSHTKVSATSRTFFDGVLKASDDLGDGSEVDASHASFESFGPRSKLARLAEQNDTLSELYPRVVMVFDTFEGEVPDSTVVLIEKLLSNNVHVVFLTPRPAKGENSAEEILGSKIKSRTGNPLIIAAHNGANITARNSNSENPTPVVEDLPGFADGDIGAFQKITQHLKKDFGFRGNIKDFGFPSAENAITYGGELPNKTVDAKAWAKAYNTALRKAGLKYRVTMGVGKNGRPHFLIQSSDMKLNMGRVYNALYARFPDLLDTLKPAETLILADTKKAGAAIKALPGKGHHIYHVSDEASMHDAFASVLGKKSYKQIRVTRSKIRAFISWENQKARRGGRGGGGAGTGKNRAEKKKTGSMHRNLAFYRGIIVYNLMPKLYRIIRKGQYDQATLEAAYELLNRMWYNPMSEWVRINDELDAARKSPIWKNMEKGYLESVRVWISNYYRRNFPNYPRNLGEEVIGKLVNTHMDIGNGISLGYTSPYTDNRYIVKVLPNRVFLEYDDEGPVLIAHVDRSGREPYQQEFDESIETNLVGRATLKGYGELRSDGIWYVNDEPNPKIKVVYHYNTRDLSHVFSPQELEANAVQLTTLIDRMQADQEFLDDFAEQEAKNRKLTDAAKKKRQEKAAARKHAETKKKRAIKRSRMATREAKKGGR